MAGMLSRHDLCPRLPGNRGALAPGRPGSLPVERGHDTASPRKVKIPDSNALRRVCFRERVGWGWRHLVKCLLVALPVLAMTFSIAHAQSKALPQPLCDFRERLADGRFRDLKGKDLRTAEAACIRRDQAKITRSADVLTIVLDNGQRKSLRDTSCETADCQHHTFMGYLPEINSVVVLKGCVEFCHDVLLVNLGDGEVLVAEQFPEFSPNRSKFVIVTSSEFELATPDVRLFEVRQRKPIEIFNYTKPSWEYWGFGAWLSEDLVDLTVEKTHKKCEGRGGGNFVKFTPKLVNVSGAWRLDLGASAPSSSVSCGD
jgi:hypothetical protein